MTPLERFVYTEDHVVAEPFARVHTRLPEIPAGELFTRIGELCDDEIEPQAAEREEARLFRRALSKEGLLALPFATAYGGSAQPFIVYLRVLEELAAAHLTVGLGVSVHTLACHAFAAFGTAEQRAANLPDMLTGGLLGAYSAACAFPTAVESARRGRASISRCRNSTPRDSASPPVPAASLRRGDESDPTDGHREPSHVWTALNWAAPPKFFFPT